MAVQTLRAREEAWRLLLHSTGGEVRATVTIHTDVVAGYVLNVRASLQRPSILTSEVLEFHQTEVDPHIPFLPIFLSGPA